MSAAQQAFLAETLVASSSASIGPRLARLIGWGGACLLAAAPALAALLLLVRPDLFL